jgi:type VI secretion system protein ImpH
MDPRPDALTTDEVLERVLARARRMPFVTFVHLVERLRQESTPVGTSGPFSREALRFRHDSSLSFQASDVSHARLAGRGAAAQVELTTAFLGLTGAASPLPLLCADLSHEDEDTATQRELLDVFHHRLLSLLVRGILKYDYPRSFQAEGQDALSTRLLALAELPAGHAQRLSGLSPALLLRLIPLLTVYPPNAERLRLALMVALEDTLGGAEVKVESFAGDHVEVSERDRPRLGQSFRLGESAALGSRVRAPQSKVRIAIGPLDSGDLPRFSPGGDANKLLSAVAELLLPQTVDFELELLARESIPWRLGMNTKNKLGRSSWLGGTKNPAPLRFMNPRTRSRDEASDGH